MTERAPDVLDMIAAWLQPVIAAAVRRDTDDVLPFVVVSRVAGAEDPWAGVDDPTIQLDLYGDGPHNTWTTAVQTVAPRMNLLATNPQLVTLSDATQVAPDYITNTIGFFEMPYEHETIVRLTARYLVGTSYVAT